MNISNYLRKPAYRGWVELAGRAVELRLEEFLGDHWSRQAFHHILDSEEDWGHVRSLSLASREVSQERLCFLFELSECRWKPQLSSLLSRLSGLTTLHLTDFCDDDTVSLVGRHCPKLAHLTIALAPESFSEQQLSDEGFADLVESQLEQGSRLQQVRLADCYSSTISAKTVLQLSRIPTLNSLSARQCQPNVALTRQDGFPVI